MRRTLLALVLALATLTACQRPLGGPGAGAQPDNTLVVKVACGGGWGSAVRIKGGRYLTADHVVSCAQSAGWRAVWRDTKRDVAIIVPTTGTVPQGGYSVRKAIAGEAVWCIGYPGDPTTGQGPLSVTEGLVSSIGENGRLRISCPVYPGASGGAVVAQGDGAVVGVISSMAVFVPGLPIWGWSFAAGIPDHLTR